MKVECIKVINPITGEESRAGSWLTVGRIYIVLAISVDPQHPVYCRCIGNDGRTPVLFDSRQFKTVSGRIPSNWVTMVDTTGSLEIGPAKWFRPGFWEEFFDRDPMAIKEFEEEYAIIVQEANSE